MGGGYAILSEYPENTAEWSSPVARRAHNPKVAGSNPASATSSNRAPLLQCNSKVPYCSNMLKDLFIYLMKKIGIIDADLIGRRKHRFPNLACEKISGYWKENDGDVHFLLDYNWDDSFDHIYISKVFTDTPSPEWLKETKQVHLGGTGFYFDKAPNLPEEIEHHMPDYHLYDDWIRSEAEKAERDAWLQGKDFDRTSFMLQFKEYTDYSIGFLTRGCFRKCDFCVNKKYDEVVLHSPLEEFFDESRKKICLLDDNLLGCAEWRKLISSLIDSDRAFKFKQGIDERLLTDEKCKLLFDAKYDGDFTFAFDNIEEYDLIQSKLELIRKHTKKRTIKFYVLVGFKSTDALDIENAFRRIALLMEYQCLPYLMRYQSQNDAPWRTSPYSGMYVSLARWCNQPNIFKKMSFRQFCEANQKQHKTAGTFCSAMRALLDFETRHPEIAKQYFDLKYEPS